MAKRSTHTIGLDIGTSRVTCIVAAPSEDGLLSVIGTGESDAKGLRKGVIVRPMNAYGLPHHLRITVGNAQENARLVAALRELL